MPSELIFLFPMALMIAGAVWVKKNPINQNAPKEPKEQNQKHYKNHE